MARQAIWATDKKERLTEHEGLREQRRESDEETAKAAPDVGKLWCLAGASESRVVRVPVKLSRRGGVAEGMVREGVCVRALPVVSFLHERMSVARRGSEK